MSDEMKEKQIEVSIIGKFEKTIVAIDGKEVPNISISIIENFEDETVRFVLDINSHSIDVPRTLADGFILFVADAMAQGAGYSCFGTDRKFNKYNRMIIPLNGMDMDDLMDYCEKQESE